jgi:hypothetical protein
MISMLRMAAVGLTLAALAPGGCAPRTIECAPGANAMSVTEMFFGRDIYGKGEVSEAQWTQFVRDTIIPRFPDGFTVLDATGQYLDTARNAAISEKSKIVIIAAGDDAASRAKLGEIAQTYKTRFEQQAVGMITRPACASF